MIANNNLIIWGMFFLILVFLILGFLDTRSMKKRLKIFFNGSRAQDFEELLAQEIKKTRMLEESIKNLSYNHDDTRKIALNSVHKMGVVRFNPFNDMGGDQSFSIALLDAKNNGVILSSLYTREGVKVYAKPVNNGESKYLLSDEEKSALKEAMKR